MTYPQAPGNPGPTHLARVYTIDVAEPAGPPIFETVFGLSSFQESKSGVTQDGSTFDTGVLQVNETVGFALDINGTVKVKPYGGVESEGQRIIREAAESYAIPQPQVLARWYKRDGTGDAKQALFQCEWNPQAGGTTDLMLVDFVLHAQTLPTVESNPATGGGTGEPDILSVTPPGKAVGEMVAIRGNGFGDATGVDIDSTAADFIVVNSGLIIATVPSGASTGAVDVEVTNTAGTSDPFIYTVA